MILAIGEVLFDELPGGSRPGGAPFNFAQHLRRMGRDVRLVSAIGGRDNEGAELLRLILNAGLDPNFIQRHPDAVTGRVRVVLAGNGIPSYDIVKPAAYDFIDFDALPPMDPELVYFGSLIQRTTEARKKLHAYLCTLPSSAVRFYDVNFRGGCVSEEIVLPSLDQTDILKLNDEELPVVGQLIGSDLNGDRLAEHILDRFSIRKLVLTRGPKGCALYNRFGKTEVPPGPLQKKEIVDTVGAGDAFSAMTAHGFLRGDDNRYLLEQSTRLAEFVCTIPGAVPEDDLIYESLKGEKDEK